MVRFAAALDSQDFLWDFQDLWSPGLWHPWCPSASHRYLREPPAKLRDDCRLASRGDKCRPVCPATHSVIVAKARSKKLLRWRIIIASQQFVYGGTTQVHGLHNLGNARSVAAHPLGFD